ncbi:MAG TPA: ABC transporter permease [Streptosporangiaceae bacterium]
MKLARDTWLIFQRHLLLLKRSPVQIAFSLAMPVTYLVIFAPMLKIALGAAGATSYAQVYRLYVPSLLTIIAVMGGVFTGFGLLAEIRSGIIERARVTPVSRVALMLGRALREVVTLLVQSLIVTVLALPFGLRVQLGFLLLAYLLLALLSLMAVSVSYGVTMRLRNEAALGPSLSTVTQPVMLLSGVVLPLTLAPLWLVRIADFNPFYWATNGMRALFAGQAAASSVWESLLIVAGLTALAMTWSVRLFARATQ